MLQPAQRDQAHLPVRIPKTQLESVPYTAEYTICCDGTMTKIRQILPSCKMFLAASAKHFASFSHGIRRIPAVCAAQDDTLVL